MKSKTFFAVFALFMGMATLTNAQGRHGYDRRDNDNNYGRDNDYNYNNSNNNGYYNGNSGNCNNSNGDYNNNGYNRNRCGNGNGYRYRRVYRRPANYCQPVPVVVYTRPRYYQPAPRLVIGRPRVNINIGF